jgi:hypothetical protein
MESMGKKSRPRRSFTAEAAERAGILLVLSTASSYSYKAVTRLSG